MRARETGFTLLEMLVSLFILALTAAMLTAVGYPVWRQA